MGLFDSAGDAFNTYTVQPAKDVLNGDAAAGVSKAAGEANPFKKQPATTYDPTAPKSVIAPAMGAGEKAPIIDASGLTGAKIGSVADPRMAIINQSPQDQFRQSQIALAQHLASQANGTGPSIAANQLRQGQEANVAGTLAVLNSQRGAANPALARQAMQTNAEQQGKMAMDSATARLQEQMMAAGMLNNVTSAGRTQDIGLATSQAGLEQQANLAKYQGSLQTALEQGRIDQNTYNEQMQNARQNAQMAGQFQALQAQYAGMGMNAAEANQAAALRIQQMKADQALGAQKLDAADQERRNQLWQNIFSSGAQGAASQLPGGASGEAGSALTTAVG